LELLVSIEVRYFSAVMLPAADSAGLCLGGPPGARRATAQASRDQRASPASSLLPRCAGSLFPSLLKGCAAEAAFDARHDGRNMITTGDRKLQVGARGWTLNQRIMRGTFSRSTRLTSNDDSCGML
jgi:hypothetical protein